MKKLWIGLMLAVMVVGFSVGIYAKPGKGHDKPGKYYYGESRNQSRNDARYIINRTSRVLSDAQRAADRRHRYFGLGRAVAHQQKARDLYRYGSYRDAIFHSLRARDLAFQVIEQNRERPHREFYRDDMEERYGRSAPRDRDLDVQLDVTKIGKDDAMVHLRLDFDL